MLMAYSQVYGHGNGGDSQIEIAIEILLYKKQIKQKYTELDIEYRKLRYLEGGQRKQARKGERVTVHTRKRLHVMQFCLDLENDVEKVAVEVKTGKGDLIIANVCVCLPTQEPGDRDEFKILTENATMSIKKAFGVCRK